MVEITNKTGETHPYLALVGIPETLRSDLALWGVEEVYEGNRVHLRKNGQTISSFVLKTLTVTGLKNQSLMPASIENIRTRAFDALKKVAASGAGTSLNLIDSVMTLPPTDPIKSPDENTGTGAVTEVDADEADYFYPENDQGKKKTTKAQPPEPEFSSDALVNMLGLPVKNGPDGWTFLPDDVVTGDQVVLDTGDPKAYVVLGVTGYVALLCRTQQLVDVEGLRMHFVLLFHPDVDIASAIPANSVLLQHLNFKQWIRRMMTVRVEVKNTNEKIVAYSAYAATVAQLVEFETPIFPLHEVEITLSEHV